MQKGALSHLAETGRVFDLKVTPKASRDAVVEEPDGSLKVTTTTVPEGGKANAAVAKLLARALGVAKSRLTLVSGASSRQKRFRLD